jgi:flagellar assembly factor FliW
MLIHTSNFGDLEIPQNKVINFKEGLPGFPQNHRFAMLELDELEPFRYLHALDGIPIALYVINPFLVDSGYEFKLTESDMEDVGSSNASELTVVSVATIPEDPNSATINMMAPIVINEKACCGKQVILHESKYSVKHPLLGGVGQEDVKAQEAV